MTDAETAVTPGGQPGLGVADTVLERARAGQISLIRFLYADHDGIIRGKATHVSGLEARMSDSSANPYLALGGFIHAGLDGIRSRLDPGAAVNVDPATLSDTERGRAGACRLPASLDAALDALVPAAAGCAAPRTCTRTTAAPKGTTTAPGSTKRVYQASP